MNEKNTEKEPEMMERGIAYFLPIVEKIRCGEVTLTPISTISLTQEEFIKKYL